MILSYHDTRQLYFTSFLIGPSIKIKNGSISIHNLRLTWTHDHFQINPFSSCLRCGKINSAPAKTKDVYIKLIIQKTFVYKMIIKNLNVFRAKFSYLSVSHWMVVRPWIILIWNPSLRGIQISGWSFPYVKPWIKSKFFSFLWKQIHVMKLTFKVACKRMTETIWWCKLNQS